MNIAIIVHSKTGTTRVFADRIADKLKQEGHNVKLTQIETDVPINTGSVRKCARFTITNIPDIREFEAILLGGPVWGFSASPVIASCINSLGDLRGKKVLPFVTGGFPFKFMGAKQAIAYMGRCAEAKNAAVMPGAMVVKLCHDVEGDMEKAAAAVASALKPK